MKKIDYKKIRTFKDIQIVKGKIRYEMLVTENQLYETLMSIERIFSVASFFSRFSTGFSQAQGAYSRVSDLLGKMFHRKSKGKKKVSPEDIG